MSVYFDQSVSLEYLVVPFPSNDNLKLTDNFTIEFFVKQQEASNIPFPYSLLLVGNYRYDVSTNLSFYTKRTDNLNKVTIFQGSLPDLKGTRNIGDNQWHHVALVRNNYNLPAKSKLRAYYKFNTDSIEGNLVANYASGTPVYDATLMNGASINTTDYKRGNGSLQLNGSLNQYLQQTPFTYSSEGFSFAIWFKSNNSGPWARIMDYGYAPDNNNVLIAINPGGNNSLQPIYNQIRVGSYSDNYNNNVWTHLVLTINPSGEWKTYINGVLITTAPGPYPTLVENNFVWLGKSLYTTSADANFNGLMDECLLYDTVLTASDVTQIYSGSNNITLYVDGISDGNLTSNDTIDYKLNDLLIGRNDPGTSPSQTKFQGYLSNLRIVNGTAVYTSNFTPPTTSLTNIPGTALLLFNNPSNLFVDGSSNNYTVTKYTSPNFPTASTDTPVAYAVCFKENSKILSLVDGVEKEILVQDIRQGILVKTLLNGYVPVHMIGTSKLFNPENSERFTDRLYLCKKEMYPDLNEDLIITGGHAILVDELKENEKEKTLNKFKEIYVTDNKYRLIAEFDDRAVPYEVEGEFNIYHFSLENENYYYNYGIYANGLLVETCSNRYLTELSNMKFL